MSLQHARQRLLTIRSDIEARLARTRRHIHRAEEVNPNFHEQVVETSNDAVVQALDAAGQRELQQIERALQRIDARQYEQCSKCAEKIGTERLIALPWTDICARCAGACP